MTDSFSLPHAVAYKQRVKESQQQLLKHQQIGE